MNTVTSYKDIMEARLWWLVTFCIWLGAVYYFIYLDIVAMQQYSDDVRYSGTSIGLGPMALIYGLHGMIFAPQYTGWNTMSRYDKRVFIGTTITFLTVTACIIFWYNDQLVRYGYEPWINF